MARNDFPDTTRGLQEFNDFLEMLPLSFGSIEQHEEDHRLLDRNTDNVSVYDPHIEQLLVRRRGLTRKQWAAFVGSRPDTDAATWVCFTLLAWTFLLTSAIKASNAPRQSIE